MVWNSIRRRLHTWSGKVIQAFHNVSGKLGRGIHGLGEVSGRVGKGGTRLGSILSDFGSAIAPVLQLAGAAGVPGVGQLGSAIGALSGFSQQVGQAATGVSRAVTGSGLSSILQQARQLGVGSRGIGLA